MTKQTKKRVVRQINLLEFLSYRRPADSDSEAAFIKRYIDSVEGMQQDAYGNRYIAIGKGSKTMWTAHTDTVHSDGGMQQVFFDSTLKHIFTHGNSCLGADDGAGVYALLKLISIGKPGLYCFFRGEEIGGLGSKHFLEHSPELYTDMQRCISIDRKGYDSVITNQTGDCCSKEFAKEFATRLGGDFKPDRTGSFTDSDTFKDVIPECTNLSSGYFNAHTASEYLDVKFIKHLVQTLAAIDIESLPVTRDPMAIPPVTNYNAWGSNSRGYRRGQHWDAKTNAWVNNYAPVVTPAAPVTPVVTQAEKEKAIIAEVASTPVESEPATVATAKPRSLLHVPMDRLTGGEFVAAEDYFNAVAANHSDIISEMLYWMFITGDLDDSYLNMLPEYAD